MVAHVCLGSYFHHHLCRLGQHLLTGFIVQTVDYLRIYSLANNFVNYTFSIQGKNQCRYITPQRGPLGGPYQFYTSRLVYLSSDVLLCQ